MAMIRDLAIVAACTLLGWHHHEDMTLVFGIFGTLLGASVSSRGTRLGVQAVMLPSPMGATLRPPSAGAHEGDPRPPFGSTL